MRKLEDGVEVDDDFHKLPPFGYQAASFLHLPSDVRQGDRYAKWSLERFRIVSCCLIPLRGDLLGPRVVVPFDAERHGIESDGAMVGILCLVLGQRLFCLIEISLLDPRVDQVSVVEGIGRAAKEVVFGRVEIALGQMHRAQIVERPIIIGVEFDEFAIGLLRLLVFSDLFEVVGFGQIAFPFGQAIPVAKRTIPMPRGCETAPGRCCSELPRASDRPWQRWCRCSWLPRAGKSPDRCRLLPP